MTEIYQVTGLPEIEKVVSQIRQQGGSIPEFRYLPGTATMEITAYFPDQPELYEHEPNVGLCSQVGR